MKKHSSQTSGVVSREVVCLFWHELRLLCKRTVVYNVLRWGPAELNTLGVNFPPLLDRHLLVAETALSSTCVKRVVHHCCDYVGGVFYCQLPSLFVSFTDSKKKSGCSRLDDRPCRSKKSHPLLTKPKHEHKREERQKRFHCLKRKAAM